MNQNHEKTFINIPAQHIEAAVRAHILELTVEQVKTANLCVSEADMAAIVDEAVQWAREH